MMAAKADPAPPARSPPIEPFRRTAAGKARHPRRPSRSWTRRSCRSCRSCRRSTRSTPSGIVGPATRCRTRACWICCPSSAIYPRTRPGTVRGTRAWTATGPVSCAWTAAGSVNDRAGRRPERTNRARRPSRPPRVRPSFPRSGSWRWREPSPGTGWAGPRARGRAAGCRRSCAARTCWAIPRSRPVSASGARRRPAPSRFVPCSSR
mmetsp:Transcript_10206/g.41256  ORF Transcript_10206/g.41256 Transcript_10206/m.41256 type:complete len:207 (-) Transcript_10206:1216-1836(-)